MSFVTTPMRADPASCRHSAAMRLLLPDPTGPPTPMRRARPQGEDAQFLRSTGVLDAERIVAVQTGCCPHTAIRDDISTNLEAVADLELATGPLDLVFVESGGDNLTAIFSPALADAQIFVIDVAGGDDIPRKGGPGIARADLLVINKTDLAPFVGSDVELMVREARARRGELPVEAVSLARGDAAVEGSAAVAAWVVSRLEALRSHGHVDSSVAGITEEHHHHVH